MTGHAEELAPILAAWGLDAPRCEVTPLAGGRINEGFIVRGARAGPYLLQRINARVFVDPTAVIDNQRLVLEHLRERAPELVLPLLPTREGEWCVTGADGVWRLQPYLARERSVTVLANAEQADAAGRAFGRFQALLADLPAERLKVVLPRFHDLPWQLERLEARLSGAVETMPGRLRAAREECRFARSRRALGALAGSGPAGVIHGDCKLANLLFAPEADRVAAVLDLDTVMLAARALDFGDLIRSATSETAVLEWYRPIAAGFWRGFWDAPAASSAAVDPAALRSAMIDAPLYMSFMLGLRFLVDYLDGGGYFKADADGDGLERARRQLRLAAALEQRRAEMADILERL